MNIDDLLAGRAPQNGDYSETAAISQNIKAAMRDSKNWQWLPPIQSEALEMIANKIARICNGDYLYQDHWIDIEGYARLVSTRLSEPAQKTAGEDFDAKLEAILAEHDGEAR